MHPPCTHTPPPPEPCDSLPLRLCFYALDQARMLPVITGFGSLAPTGRGGADTLAEGKHGRRGSIVGGQYEEGMRAPKGGGLPPERPPTNEEVAKAVQQKVAVRTAGRREPGGGGRFVCVRACAAEAAQGAGA